MARQITLVGLGPGSLALLTRGALEALQTGAPVILRTGRHPVAAALPPLGIHYATLDSLYEQEETFEAVYERMVDRLLAAATQSDVVYAVPGHPLVGERSVQLLMQRAPAAGVRVEVAGGSSFLDALFTATGLDPLGGMELLDALDLDQRRPAGDLPLVVAQVYSRAVASEVKLALMEVYPDDHRVTLVRAAGLAGEERLATVPLYEIDHHDWVDHLTSLYVPPVQPRGHRRYPLDPVVDVTALLRGPGGCPWDREQTHRSLRRYLVEEAYEVVEAIDRGDDASLVEELGDVLLQVVFHAQMASEDGRFTIRDVVDGLAAKLVRRHPHVFGDVSVRSSADVVVTWEAVKAKEKGKTSESVLDGIARSLPALLRAAEIQRKAAKVGFDWQEIAGPLKKVREELRELMEAYRRGEAEKLEEELGDLLFAVVNLARFVNVDPELALARTNAKFMRRFGQIESHARAQGRRLEELTLEEMDRLWEESKEGEKRG